MIVIPTISGVSRYSQRTILDGREYVFSFSWNSRAAVWSVSVADAAGVPIVDGIRINVGQPLFRLVRDPRCFPGEVIAVDRDGAGDPGFLDLGTRVFLSYIEAKDLATG